MSYDSTVQKIPHASVTSGDAMMIRRMINRAEKVQMTLKMSARMLPDAESHNVIGELRGREKPAEIGGVFAPLDFGFTGSPAARAIVEAIGGLLAPISADDPVAVSRDTCANL